MRATAGYWTLVYETGFLQLGQRPELWLALQLLQAKALQCLHCQKGPIGGEHWFEVFATQSSFCAIFPAYTRVSARPRKRLDRVHHESSCADS